MPVLQSPEGGGVVVDVVVVGLVVVVVDVVGLVVVVVDVVDVVGLVVVVVDVVGLLVVVDVGLLVAGVVTVVTTSSTNSAWPEASEYATTFTSRASPSAFATCVTVILCHFVSASQA
jgi:hypothetical protein